MFSLFKKAVSSLYSNVSEKVSSLFSQTHVDHETIKELEKLLISADVGVKSTKKLTESFALKMKSGSINKGSELKEALETELLNLLGTSTPTPSNIFLLVGINGSGKTTFSAKLAHHLIKQNQKVLLIAADTFRAAAPEQLAEWAKKTGADIFQGELNQDPASVVFKGCQKFINENYDALIVDTAGRLQTKTNLMNELEKIKRVINKNLPDASITSLLTIDAMLGQNSFEQARLFNEATSLSGIVLTKMDGTAKGGIAIAIKQEFNLPIYYVSYGEQLDDFTPFNAEEYVKSF